MSDVIGRAVIEVSADSTKLSAGMDSARRSVANLGSTIGSTVADGTAKASRSIDAYVKKLELSAFSVGMTTSQVKLMELAQRGATDTQLKAADAAFRTLDAYKAQQTELRKTADAARTGAAVAAAAHALQGNSAKLTAHQTQQLSFQLNDLFVQIASGQSPLTALIQQGSQLNGTFGGIGGTMRAVGSIFTTTRVLIGGAATAVAGLGYAAYEGSKQSSDFARSIALTGNAAGITEGQLNSLIRTTSGVTREYAQALIKTGEIGPEVFTSAAAAASGYAKMTGKTADEVAAVFVKMGESPTKFAEQANRSLNFLSATQYQAIKAFEDGGRAADAQGIIYSALLERSRRLDSGLGTLERTLQSGKKAWSEFWEAASGIGRAETIEDRIAKTSKKIAELRDRQQTANPYGPDAGKTSSFSVVQPGGKGSAPQAAAQIAAAEAELNGLRRKQFRETENAYAESLNGQINKEAIAASAAVDGWLKRSKAASVYKQELDKLTSNFDKMALAGTPVNDADKKIALAALKKEYTDTGAARDASRLGKSQMGLDVEKVKAALAVLTNSYMNAENILEAQRSAGLVGEKAYYEQKRKLIQDEGAAEANGLEDEATRLKAQKATGADALDIQKKLVDVQAQITIAKANTTAKVTTLDIQQKNSIDQVARSYAEARISAQEYLDTISRGIDREVEAFPRGDKERNRVSARQQIEDRYTQQRLELENNKRLMEMQKDPDTGASRFTSEARDKYTNQLALLDEYQAKALAKWDAGYKAIGALESDWSTGAKRALENYADASVNTSKLTEGLFSNAFQGMEDAIVQFSMTGKLSFSAMTKSIIADIIRIQARQQVAGLASSAIGALSGMFDTSTRSAEMGRITAQASAAGGYDIPAGVNPVVQTHAREMILPEQYADVIRNMANGGGGSGPKVTINVIDQNKSSVEVTQKQTGDGLQFDVLIRQLEGAMAENVAYGTGSLNAAFQGRYGLRPSVG